MPPSASAGWKTIGSPKWYMKPGRPSGWEQVAGRACKGEKVFPGRGRREDLRVGREPSARHLRPPGEASVRDAHRVQIAPLRVEHLPLAVGRARALIGPAAGDRVDADVVVGLRQLGRRRGAPEADRRVERSLRVLPDGDAATLVAAEVVGLGARAQGRFSRDAAAYVEALQALVSLAAALLLLRDDDVAADDHGSARPRV